MKTVQNIENQINYSFYEIGTEQDFINFHNLYDGVCFEVMGNKNLLIEIEQLKNDAKNIQLHSIVEKCELFLATQKRFILNQIQQDLQIICSYINQKLDAKKFRGIDFILHCELSETYYEHHVEQS